MARRRTRRKTRKSRRRSRRKSRRKSRRRKSRKRRRRTKQRGGNKVQVNKLNLKVMEPPVSTNNNWNVPRNPAQLGGRRRRPKKTKSYTKRRGL